MESDKIIYRTELATTIKALTISDFYKRYYTEHEELNLKPEPYIDFAADRFVYYMLDNPELFKIILLRANGKEIGMIIGTIQEVCVLSDDKFITGDCLYILPEYRCVKAMLTLVKAGVQLAESLGLDIMVNRREDESDGLHRRLGFVPAYKFYIRKRANNG